MSDTIAASMVTDHAFSARPAWALCERCGLSQAAHQATASPLRTVENYRCPECVWAGEYRRPPLHRDCRKESA